MKVLTLTNSPELRVTIWSHWSVPGPVGLNISQQSQTLPVFASSAKSLWRWELLKMEEFEHFKAKLQIQLHL